VAPGPEAGLYKGDWKGRGQSTASQPPDLQRRALVLWARRCHLRLKVQQQLMSGVEEQDQGWQNSSVITQLRRSLPSFGMRQAGMGSLPG